LTNAVGIGVSRFVAQSEPVFGKLPPAREIPLVRLPRWKIIRLMLPVVFTNDCTPVTGSQSTATRARSR
jgi:hypothetical protein